LAQSGARIVVWDETAIRTTAQEESSVIFQGGTLAREENIYLLMGLRVYLPPDSSSGLTVKAFENKAVLIGPDGSVLWNYHKGNPMPGSREVGGDKEVQWMNTPIGVLGSVICYDMDNPGFIRQAGRARVGLLLVPTWDWPAIENLHMAMAQFRAVENGFSIVRSTREGYSAAFDGLGNPLALSGRNTSERTLIADVPVESVWTVYPLLGDWFGWLCVAGLIGLILISVWRSPRVSKIEPQ
jgi:apolipoprotein N-acyltransferase